MNNYKQALDILKGEAALQKTIADQAIDGSEATFQGWLLEERTYLKNLQKEPLQEMLEMEYLQKLLDWHGAE